MFTGKFPGRCRSRLLLAATAQSTQIDLPSSEGVLLLPKDLILDEPPGGAVHWEGIFFGEEAFLAAGRLRVRWISRRAFNNLDFRFVRLPSF